MNKKSLSERDICTKFITPALATAGWDIQRQVREESLVDSDEAFSIFESLALLKSRRDCVTPEYLRLSVQEACFQLDESHVKGVGVKHLHLNVIRRLAVLVPSIDEQRRIVAKVTELLALCDQLKARITAARSKHAQLAEALVAHAVAA